MVDITTLSLDELDELGVLEAERLDGVEIVDAFIDANAPHGENSEAEMAAGIASRFRSLVARTAARLSTSQLRKAWSPPCTGPWARVDLNGQGRVTVRPSIVEAVRALNAVLIAFHYLTRLKDTGAYNCRKITNGILYSLHAFAIALDLNWGTNPYGRKLITDMPPAMRAAIKAIRTKSGAQVWGWGGDYSKNKDAMHWEIVCTPADLASGIDWHTVAGAVAIVINRGPNIKFVQQMLNILLIKAGEPTLDPDGKLGDKTKQALAKFQLNANKYGHKPPLPVNGNPDAATCAAIGDWVNLIMKPKGK